MRETSEAERHTVWRHVRPKRAHRGRRKIPRRRRVFPLGPGRGPGDLGFGRPGGAGICAAGEEGAADRSPAGVTPDRSPRGSGRRCLARGSCVCWGSGPYLPVSIATAAAIASKGAEPPAAQRATAGSSGSRGPASCRGAVWDAGRGGAAQAPPTGSVCGPAQAPKGREAELGRLERPRD